MECRSCVVYAQDNNPLPVWIIVTSLPTHISINSQPFLVGIVSLLNTPGWKLLKRHARTARRLIRTLKKSKYRLARASRKYKHMSSATQITQKEPKETTKERGISLTIMGQRSIYNSIHKPQPSLNETIGFNQDDHLQRMCNKTGIPEFLELQIPGIPMVVMVTSRAHSLHDPTQQDLINTRTLPIYICHT